MGGVAALAVAALVRMGPDLAVLGRSSVSHLDDVSRMASRSASHVDDLGVEHVRPLEFTDDIVGEADGAASAKSAEARRTEPGRPATLHAGLAPLPDDLAAGTRYATGAPPFPPSATPRRLTAPLHHLADLSDVNRPAPATYEVFIVAPEDPGQAQRIFTMSGDPPYAAKAVEDARLARVALGANARNQGGAYDLLRAIETSESSYISIIGHNQHGQIIFPDGTGFHLATLSKRCKELGKFCILLSCKSKYVARESQAGMHVRLTYRDAAAISARIEKIVGRAHGSISPRHIEKQIKAALMSSDLAIAAADAVKLAYIPVTGVGIGAMVISVDPD
jgi:hypothetical protein